MEPLSFQAPKIEINDVPIDVHNKLVEDYEALQNELKRCRQKVAHLIKENEELAKHPGS